MPDLDAYATHSPYTDPGRHAALLRGVGTDPAALHAASCRTVIHYRAGAEQLVPGQDADIDLRWLADILGEAQRRAAGPLDAERPPVQQIAGCCRDHTLVAVAVLREHGIPARSRVGFAAYFRPGFHHDHVVAERWAGSRWVRFDPELDAGDDWFDFDSHDLPTGLGAPFETAAEVWRAHRLDGLDVSTYGVDPSLPELCGPEFVRGYVVTELAHRRRDELLLWDVWGDTMPETDTPADELDRLADEVAALLVAADAGDGRAEAELTRRYATDARLRPGGSVVTLSPTGRVGDADLLARVNRWRS
ncbi:transglutaminase-like domain-containing protein [Cellulomonas fengjieae]|uniref:Transglutaminase domain-containing protein n=1 Tax=Cellulomonas fengjieae TaxID=2819978 RepID=A0ABS3SMF7_9CELL|nr:transglutaminase-like domain-containing protein [Cellulomonas fengjieae]MBO3086509.1 transglutaminase domain-containing protein [Cellulomonas fengjieae]MBO3100505.1 transglutaminase domain-containing protein [Cellulomonas fengjieae]QVI66632.1 transglutaminase domain-containing protein [Cellulomonas fengjieae]